jgi:hypothetical protein
MTSVTIVGILMLLSGFALRLIISKNRFDRRGPAGLQHFESYWKALFASIAQWLFGIVAFALIVGGAVLLLIEWYNHH